jgi:hypothetical protein
MEFYWLFCKLFSPPCFILLSLINSERISLQLVYTNTYHKKLTKETSTTIKMTDKIPTFEWNSEESGKKEFHVFEAALQSHLATRQCCFVLDNHAIAINTPINPGPEPPGIMDAREWRQLN